MIALKVHQALLLILLLTATAVCLALEVPSLSGRVVDGAQILSPETRERLTELSRQHEQKTSNQIAILTVPTLESANIEEFAVRVFEHWKLGQLDKDNGVLLLIAPRERSLRIEVGYGLEGTLPDAIASRIIRNVITPQFKNGNFDAGVTDGMRALISVLEGAALPAVERASKGETSTRSAARPVAELRFKKRLLAGCVIFGMLGLFTFIGILLPGAPGWVLYVFMLPFWALFPRGLLGTHGTLILLGIYLVGIPVIRVLIARSGWYEKTFPSNGASGSGGFGRGSSRSWSSGGSGRSRGFSGGGGRSGGGGASGRW